VGRARPLPPNDLWWHARIGGEILDTGHIPRHDVYSLTERGQPFFYQSWLAEVVMAGLLRLGGLRLLVFTRALIMLALFGTVLLLCWWASEGNGKATVMATLGAILLGLGNQTVRPQLFAYPIFIAVYALLWLYLRGGAKRSVWLIPLLVMIWVNVHGSFALGLGLIWLVFIGGLLSLALPKLAGRLPAWGTNAREWLTTLGLIALLSTALILFNPRGLDILGYVADLMTDVPSQTLGAEWQPLNPRAGLGQSFYLMLLLGVAIFALARPPVPLTDLLLFLAFAWLGACGLRYAVWFGVVGAPVVAGALPRFPWDDLARWRERFARRALGQRLVYGDGSGYPGFRRLALAAVILCLLAVTALYLFYPDADLWLTDRTGTAAVEFMDRNGMRGRLFNELGRGSYVIWSLGPAQPVFIDPRFELYSLEHFQDYLTLSNAKQGAESLLDGYDFDLLLLDRDFQANLVTLLDRQPERWRRAYADSTTLLYERLGE